MTDHELLKEVRDVLEGAADEIEDNWGHVSGIRELLTRIDAALVQEPSEDAKQLMWKLGTLSTGTSFDEQKWLEMGAQLLDEWRAVPLVMLREVSEASIHHGIRRTDENLKAIAAGFGVKVMEE